jgi:sugar/nucleoside kinase (ribokinase family)
MVEHPGHWDVVGVGANSIDYVNVLPAWPEQEGPRSKMRVVRRLRCPGGQTATALAACAGFGLRAKYVGCVGNDDNGQAILADLAGRNVDVADAATGGAPNGSAVILIVETRGACGFRRTGCARRCLPAHAWCTWTTGTRRWPSRPPG